MKANFSHSLTCVLTITLLILGAMPFMVAAEETPSESGGNSTTNSTILLPDLTIDNFEYPKQSSSGEFVDIYIDVKNQGTAASEETVLTIYINGNSVNEERMPKLSEGKSEEYRYSWIPTSEGPIEIKAVVDKDNLISESDESNNEKTGTVVVGESFLPDLIIEDIVPESEGVVGKPLNLILKVKNQGTSASGEAKAEYYINGIAPSQNVIQIPALQAGKGTDATFSLIPDKEGKMEVKVRIDSGTSVESNVNNNEFTKTIDVKTLLPDLVIESFSLNPQAPKIGDNVAFTVSIKNKGLIDSASSELEYSINGNSTTYSNRVSVPAIAAGGTTTSIFYWVPENEGNVNVRLIADVTNTISEDDETNNEFIKSISVSKQTTSSEESSDSSSSGTSSSSSSGSSGSSSSMGSSVSKEPAKNVEIKELATRNIINGYHVRYDFTKNVTCITYIEFDPTKTFKKTTATVEVLKGKSTFVKKNPPGRIYKQVNIWVGDEGAGLPDSHKNAYTGFKVDREWIKSNSVNESNITLLWYDKGNWKQLSTEKAGEDDNYVYFRAETSGYSCFAISEYTGEDGTVKESSNETGLQETLRSLGDESILNSSAEREGDIEKKIMGKAKILLAVSLPLFMIFVGYFVLKKKI